MLWEQCSQPAIADSQPPVVTSFSHLLTLSLAHTHRLCHPPEFYPFSSNLNRFFSSNSVSSRIHCTVPVPCFLSDRRFYSTANILHSPSLNGKEGEKIKKVPWIANRPPSPVTMRNGRTSSSSADQSYYPPPHYPPAPSSRNGGGSATAGALVRRPPPVAVSLATCPQQKWLATSPSQTESNVLRAGSP